MHPDLPPDLPNPDNVTDEQTVIDQRAKAAEAAAESAASDAHHSGVIDDIREFASAAYETFVSSLSLARTEFRLARDSALFVLMLGCVMIVLAVGTWLGLLALLAVGTAKLTGSWPLGFASVVLVNVLGGVWVILMIRRSLRDMSMPRTRRMIAGMRPRQPGSGSGTAVKPSSNAEGINP